MKELNVPFRSMVSLDVQTIENWKLKQAGVESDSERDADGDSGN